MTARKRLGLRSVLRAAPLLVLPALSAGAARGEADLLRAGNLATMKCASPDENFVLVRSSQPGNVFYPGDSVDLTLRVRRGDEPVESVRLEVLEIAMRENKYLEGRSESGMSGPPAVEMLGSRGRVNVPVKVEDRQGATAEVTTRNLPVPARYGAYTVTVAPNGRRPQFLCTLIRAMKPRDGFFVDAPVFGEGQFMTHDEQKPELVRLRAMTLARLGIKGVRIELGWSSPRPGEYDWRRLDVLMNSLAEAKVKALVTMGGQPYWVMPLGHPTPACIPEKPDHSCMPKYYDQFGEWIRAFSERYWKDGQGSLWAIEHWNEPWEGISISGWESDSNHYRELMKRIAVNTRAVDPRIKTAAACSIMNTEDKFLTGENREELIGLVDLFTDHYVPARTSYGPMVAKFWGKESTDTESWIAATEFLLPQIMCQFMACGQDRVTPWHPAMTYFRVPGAPMKHFMPNPVALATNVFNCFITGRDFERVLFMEHLPWAFQFGRHEDAVVVLFGRMFAPHGGNVKDILWWQLNLEEGGSMTIDNADGRLEFYDVAGNREFEGEPRVTLPMNYLARYVKAPRGGVELITERLRAARIEGVRPVEIVARDFAAPIDCGEAAVRVTLHNFLNRPVTGKLEVTPPEGVKLERASVDVNLGAGKTADYSVKVASADPSPVNVYPFTFAFRGDAGEAEWKEALHVLTVRYGERKVDGDLADWQDDLGVLVDAKLQKVDATSAAWMPFLKAKDAQPDGSFAEVKLAWDTERLYVAARVNDPTDYAGHLRLAEWDEDQYFRSAKDDEICETLRPYERFVRADMRNPDVAGRMKKDPEWSEYQTFLTKSPDAADAVRTNAARGYFEARSRNPSATFADAAHVYKKVPWNDQPFAGDLLQFGLDIIPGYFFNMKPDTDRVPFGFHAMPDTDYEYSAYACAGGGSELWRLLAPGVPRGHYYPRQPRAKYDQGPVEGDELVVKREGKVTTYELAIPWAEMKLGEVPWRDIGADPWSPGRGKDFAFIFRVGNNAGPSMVFGSGKSATKTNGLALHPYWEAKPGCSVRWTLTGGPEAAAAAPAERVAMEKPAAETSEGDTSKTATETPPLAGAERGTSGAGNGGGALTWILVAALVLAAVVAGIIVARRRP